MIFKPRFLIFLLIVLVLSGCQSQRVLKTPEGIPRKVVIRQDNTPLYDSTKLSKSVATVHQWDILFVFGEAKNHYVVSPDLEESPENPFYINKSDVFEWNSYFCLTYKNSPHKSGRLPIVTYGTLEGAKNSDPSDEILIEKEEHRNFSATTDAKPILKEYDDRIYYIAALYDNIDEEGRYVFLGHYEFGFVKYNDEAHEIRRYVSKQQLSNQLNVVLGIIGEEKRTLKPPGVDKLYGPLADLLAPTDNVKKGLEDLLGIIKGPDVPKQVHQGPFPSDLKEASNTENLDPQLKIIADKMFDHLRNPDNWNEHNHTYIPVEWME